MTTRLAREVTQRLRYSMARPGQSASSRHCCCSIIACLGCGPADRRTTVVTRCFVCLAVTGIVMSPMVLTGSTLFQILHWSGLSPLCSQSDAAEKMQSCLLLYEPWVLAPLSDGPLDDRRRYLVQHVPYFNPTSSRALPAARVCACTLCVRPVCL
jgi:hypothetical protein